MIDYFFRFATEADALADALAAAQKFHVNGQWARDHVLPDVKAWRPSQDTTVFGRVVHNYLAGWFAIVSTTQPLDVLFSASPLAFALNRNGPPYLIRNNIGAIISDVACAPIFCGSHYPIGGYN